MHFYLSFFKIVCITLDVFFFGTHTFNTNYLMMHDIFMDIIFVYDTIHCCLYWSRISSQQQEILVSWFSVLSCETSLCLKFKKKCQTDSWYWAPKFELLYNDFDWEIKFHCADWQELPLSTLWPVFWSHRPRYQFGYHYSG